MFLRNSHAGIRHLQTGCCVISRKGDCHPAAFVVVFDSVFAEVGRQFFQQGGISLHCFVASGHFNRDAAPAGQLSEADRHPVGHFQQADRAAVGQFRPFIQLGKLQQILDQMNHPGRLAVNPCGKGNHVRLLGNAVLDHLGITGNGG